MVAGGSEIQDKSLAGIGRKQMGHSSLAGGSLNNASSRSSAARCLHSFFYALANDSSGIRRCNT
jgi:hypothetical protein